VSASPVSSTCSGFSAGDYSFAYVNGAVTVSRKPLTIQGTIVATREFVSGNIAAGEIIEGTLVGLVSGESLQVVGSGSAYSSSNPGTYQTTVSYILSNALSGAGLANNYTIATEILSGTITPIPVGFALSLAFETSTRQFASTFAGEQNQVTLSATITPYAAGVVAFSYKTSASTVFSPATCSGSLSETVTVSNDGTASCIFGAPAVGGITFRANYVPVDPGKSTQSKSLDSIILPKPVITNFTNSSGATISSSKANSQIAIVGSYFLDTLEVRFTSATGTTLGTNLRVSATRIIVTTPSTSGTYSVVVQTRHGGTSTSSTLTLTP